MQFVAVVDASQTAIEELNLDRLPSRHTVPRKGFLALLKPSAHDKS